MDASDNNPLLVSALLRLLLPPSDTERYFIAIASISTINSGNASRVTPTPVSTGQHLASFNHVNSAPPSATKASISVV